GLPLFPLDPCRLSASPRPQQRGADRLCPRSRVDADRAGAPPARGTADRVVASVADAMGGVLDVYAQRAEGGPRKRKRVSWDQRGLRSTPRSCKEEMRCRPT